MEDLTYSEKDDEEKLVKIFITMLFSIQFQHPASGTDKEFQ